MAQARRAIRVALLVACIPLAGTAHAEDGDGHPLRLAVGESVALCGTGTLLCPAGDTRCDDGSVVAVGGDERGPVLTALKPGSTLCSAGSASGMGQRRVYRVTVIEKRDRSPRP